MQKRNKNGANQNPIGIHNVKLPVKGGGYHIGYYIYSLGGAFHGATDIIGVLIKYAQILQGFYWVVDLIVPFCPVLFLENVIQ